MTLSRHAVAGNGPSAWLFPSIAHRRILRHRHNVAGLGLGVKVQFDAAGAKLAHHVLDARHFAGAVDDSDPGPANGSRGYGYK